MRVLFVSTWYPRADQPSSGVFVRRHAEAVAARHDVDVVHVRLGGSGELGRDSDTGRPVLRVPLDPRSPAAWRAARGVLRERLADADLLHTNALSTLLVSAALVGPATRGRPWVHTEHWTGVTDPASVGLWWRVASPARHAYRLPQVTTAVSTYLADVVRRHGGRPVVVPNVVQGPPQPAAPPAGPTLSLAATGGLVPRKDPITAVRTVAWLRDRGHPADLTWLGDGPLAGAVGDEARRLGVAAHVRLAGNVAPSTVPEQVGGATVFLLPTREETFCVAAAEALLAGRPVVLGARGGQRDFVRPDVGRLVARHDAEGFGRAVLEAADLGRRFPPQHFADAVRDRFSADAVARAFEEAYARAASLR